MQVSCLGRALRAVPFEKEAVMFTSLSITSIAIIC